MAPPASPAPASSASVPGSATVKFGRKGSKAPAFHPIDVNVGRLLRLRRVELGMSQTALADKLGVAFQQVQKYETGSNRISASRLHQAATVLGVPVSYFFPDDATDAPDIGHLLADRLAIDLLVAFAAVPEGQRAAAVAVIRSISSTAAAGTLPHTCPGQADGASVSQASLHPVPRALRDGGRR